MKFNVSKCCHIQITKAKITTLYHYLYDTPLLFSYCCKYLGIIIQSDLKWDKHIEEKIASASRVLRLLQRNIKISSIYILLRDLALVRPKLEYASTVWSPWQCYLINAIQWEGSVPCRRKALRIPC